MTGSLITIHSEISPYLLKNSRRLSENTKVNSVNGVVLEMKEISCWLGNVCMCVMECGSLSNLSLADLALRSKACHLGIGINASLPFCTGACRYQLLQPL